MKTGINMLLWTTHVTAEHDGLLEQFKALGFDSVEIPIFDTSDVKAFERLGKRLKSLQLRATGVSVMTAEANPISPDPQVRQAAVRHFDRVLECGQACGCEILCGPLHSAIGVFSGQGPTPAEFQHGVETLRQAAEMAKSRRIMLACEYLNRFENYFLTTAAGMRTFVRAVDHPNCRMMYDSFHAHIEEKDQAAALAACMEEVIHVHVSENDRGTPGTGQVDWDGFFGGLKAGEYSGFLTIEAFGRALPALAAATKVWRDLFPDPMTLCREGLKFVREKWVRAASAT